MRALHCSIFVPRFLYNVSGLAAGMGVHTCSLWEQEQKNFHVHPRAGSALATSSLGGRQRSSVRRCCSGAMERSAYE